MPDDTPGGTQERPVKPKTGKTTKNPKKIKTLIKEGCGYWQIQFLSDPPKLASGSVDKKIGKTKETFKRLSLDNFVYFFPNPDNDCEDYAFLQFCRRTAHKVNADGAPGAEVPEYAHDWQPDIEGWKDRKVKKFIDIGEIFYDPDLINQVGKYGWARRDGPGVVYRPGFPPKNMKLCWQFQIYVVCDGGAKAVGRLDFSFCIRFDAAGAWTLEFPAPGAKGYPSLKVICCQADKEYFEWIEKWHNHYEFDKLPKDDKARAKFLRDQRAALAQALKDSKKPLNLPKPKSLKSVRPDEFRYLLGDREDGKRYDSLVFLEEGAADERLGKASVKLQEGKKNR